MWYIPTSFPLVRALKSALLSVASGRWARLQSSESILHTSWAARTPSHTWYHGGESVSQHLVWSCESSADLQEAIPGANRPSAIRGPSNLFTEIWIIRNAQRLKP